MSNLAILDRLSRDQILLGFVDKIKKGWLSLRLGVISKLKRGMVAVASAWNLCCSVMGWVALGVGQIKQTANKITSAVEAGLVRTTVALIKVYVVWKPAFIRLLVRTLSAAWILGLALVISWKFAFPYAGISLLVACLVFWLVRTE